MHHLNARLAIATLTACAALVSCGSSDAAPDEAPVATTSQPAVAASTSGDADLAEIQDYELSMDDMQSWGDANVALGRLIRENPEVARALDTPDDDMSADQSLDALEARLESVPEARDVIEDAGLSARDYGLITYAMLQAGMAQFAVEQGASIDSVAREMKVNPANIRFVMEHKAELEQLRAEMEAQNDGN